MKIIIAGSRNLVDKKKIIPIIANGLSEICSSEGISKQDIELVSGGARGIDTIAQEFAQMYNIKFTLFVANWEYFGKRAGYIRNEKMAKYADALIAIWDGQSKGTKHMINLAKKYNLTVVIYPL